MQKKFLSSLFLILLLNLLIKPFYILGIDAAVQNRVGEEIYGNYFALLNFSFLLNILNDLGISNYYTRFLSKENSKSNPDFISIFGLRILLFLVYFVLTIGLASGFNFSENELILLSLLLLNQFFIAGIQYSRATLSGLLLFKSDAIISVLDRLLLIFFCLYLLFGFEDFTIWWFVWAQTFAYALTLVFALILVFPKIEFLRRQKGIRLKKKALIKSLPFALLFLLMMLYSRIDAVMIERLLSDGDFAAGLYAQGFRFLDAVNMFALLIAGLLLPVFSSVLSKKKAFTEILNLATRLLVGLGIVVAILGYFYAEEILKWRYGSQILESSIVSFSYLMLSFFPMCLTYLYGTLLTAKGSLKHLNLMAFSSLIINLVLNYYFIQIIGFEGAALATLITQAFAALFQFILAFRILELKFQPFLMARLFLLALLTVGFHSGMTYFFEFPFMISITIDGLFSFLLVLLIKVVNFSEIKIIFQKNELSLNVEDKDGNNQ